MKIDLQLTEQQSPNAVTDGLTQTDTTSGNQNNHTSDIATNGVQSGINGISESNSVISDPRGSAVDSNDTENYTLTATEQISQQPQYPHQDLPPPYPGLPRSLTSHLRQRDEISRMIHIQSLPGNLQTSNRTVPSENMRNNALDNIPNIVST